jgi:methionyl aminopeptidase
MIHYKTSEEVQIIKQGAQISRKAHGEVAKYIKEGVKTSFLDKIAEEYIRDHQGVPSFKGYNGFPAALCISVNEVVVHGFPSELCFERWRYNLSRLWSLSPRFS